ADELWNPSAIGSNHQNGPGILYEPLAYYSAFADKEYLWLAESYKYSPDFKELTIKTRSGIKWSDGAPFSAEDVTYTLNTLKELGPKVRWGVDVQQFMQEAKTTSPNTVVVKFKVPAPRFFYNFHRIPMNTTYWTNWPTEQNAYVNGAFWHLTYAMVLWNLQPTQ